MLTAVIPGTSIDTDILKTPEARETVRKAAQPGGIDALIRIRCGSPGQLPTPQQAMCLQTTSRVQFIAEGILVALKLGMKAEAAEIGKQAAVVERLEMKQSKEYRSAANTLGVSWDSVLAALRGSIWPTASRRTKYLIGGAIVLAVLIPVGIYLSRR